MIVNLGFGKNIITYSNKDLFDVDVILPNHNPPLLSPQNKIKSILKNQSIFQKLKTNRRYKVAIVINDNTRPVPNDIIIPPLLEHLNNMGINKKNINFFVATGTHKNVSEDSTNPLLPNDVLSSFDIEYHNCDDRENLTYLGITSFGTPVEINSKFLQADIKIVIGNIEPHHYQGFSGGAKSAAIGLAGRSTIDKNHSWLMDSRSFIGNYENNPCRQDLEEIGDFIGIDLAINVVLNQDKQIFDVFIGSPREVMTMGIPISSLVCQKKVDKKYDLVIASPGGYPKDINLYQAQKAITHASLITKDGGVIILLAECSQGLGDAQFEAYLDVNSSFREIIYKFENSLFTIGPHKAYLLAKQAVKNKLILVSGLSDSIVKKTLLESADSLDNAIQLAHKYMPEYFKTAIMPFATNTIPLIPSIRNK